MKGRVNVNSTYKAEFEVVVVQELNEIKEIIRSFKSEDERWKIFISEK